MTVMSDGCQSVEAAAEGGDAGPGHAALVATMVRLAQTWALLPLPAECSWTDDERGKLFRSRY